MSQRSPPQLHEYIYIYIHIYIHIYIYIYICGYGLVDDIDLNGLLFTEDLQEWDMAPGRLFGAAGCAVAGAKTNISSFGED